MRLSVAGLPPSDRRTEVDTMAAEMIDELIEDARGRMAKSRGGHPARARHGAHRPRPPALLERVVVDYYGAPRR